MSLCSISTESNRAEANNLHIIEQEILQNPPQQTDEPAPKGHYVTCTEFNRQYPFKGNLITWVGSWFQPAFTELHMTSPVSGKISSIKAFSPLNAILSPRSGVTLTTKQSQGWKCFLCSFSCFHRSSSLIIGCSW